MRKKLLTVLFVIAIFTALLAISISATQPIEAWDISATTDDNVTATLYNDGSLVISGTGKMNDWMYSSYAPWYSSYRNEITSVKIENGVTSIGSYAFYNCSNLTNAIIPSGITIISDFAFNYCSSLTSIVIPYGVVSIGMDAFNMCLNLSNVEIPNSLTTIGDDAFGWCTGLFSILIPNSVVTMGGNVFYYCGSLTIYCEAESQPDDWDSSWNYFDSSVVWGHTHIYENHKCVCGKTEQYVEKWDISATENDNVIAYLKQGSAEDKYILVIEGTGNMKSFADYCYTPWYGERIESIESVIINDGVTNISKRVFDSMEDDSMVLCPDDFSHSCPYCSIGTFRYSSLLSVIIADSVLTVGEYAFDNCDSLTIYAEALSQPSTWNVNWNPDNRPVVWGYGSEHQHTFENYECACGATEYVEKWDISATASDSVFAYLFEDEANEGKYTLKIEGTGNMKSFADCCYTPWYGECIESIESVIINDGVTNISKHVFDSLEDGSAVLCPDDLSHSCPYCSIGTFRYSSLLSVIIADSVLTVGEYAFDNCDSLTIYAEAISQPSTWNENWNPDNRPVVWGYGSEHQHTFENYECACGATEYVEKWDISATASDSVFAYLFEDEANDGKYILGIEGTGNMKDWGDAPYWYRYTNDITSVIIEEGVTNISSFAFMYTKIENVYISSTVAEIGTEAFFSCTSLVDITVAENNASYKSIDGNLYSKNGELLIQYALGKSDAYFAVPDGVKTICADSFRFCENIKNIVISSTVTEIEGAAFWGCTSLETIFIPINVTNLWEMLLYDCKKVVVYAEAEKQPEGWEADWNGYSSYNVVWGHKHSADNPTNNGITHTFDCVCCVTVTENHTFENHECACGAIEYIEKWDISATVNDSIFAYLFNDTENEGMYTLTISGTGKMQDWTSSSKAPWHKSYSQLITSVIVENGVTNIGSFAFYFYPEITNLILPDTLISMGNFAFYKLDALTSLTIPNSVTTIGNHTFSTCKSITSVFIPDSVTSIGNGVFEYCESLESITVGDNNPAYKSINGNLYSKDGKTLVKYAEAKDETTFVIPGSVTYIGYGAFASCNNLENITIPNSVTGIGAYAFTHSDLFTSITIPDSITNIESYAFSDCDGLNSMIIPDSVTSIGAYAFYMSTNIKSVYVPISVASVGNSAFLSCSRVTIYCEAESQPSTWSENWNDMNRPVVWGHTHSATANLTNNGDTHTGNCVCGITTTEDHNFVNYECACGAIEYIEKWDISATENDSVIAYLVEDKANAGMYTLTISGTGNMNEYEYTKYPWYSTYKSNITSVTIERGVTSIGDGAFRACENLANIALPDSIVTIGHSVFHSCSNLTSVTIPEGVTSIGIATFYNCSSLTSVTIPNTVTTIGDSAFNGCESITSIHIPKSVISLGDYVFYYCYALTSITVDENNTAFKSVDGNLYTNDGKTLIQYAIGKKDASLVIPQGTTHIGNYAFRNSNNLTEIVFPDTLISVGDWAFRECKGLTSISLPSSVTSIGQYAFRNCTSLEKIIIPTRVTSINVSAFVYCSNLTIYCEAFSQPSTWDENWNPDNRPVVWGYGHQHTFENYECACGATEYVEKWDISATENDSVFAYLLNDTENEGMYTLTILGTGNMIDWFDVSEAPWFNSYTEKTTAVTIKDGVTNIGSWAFGSCSSLTSVTISNTVTIIGHWAFSGCHALTSVVTPDSVTTIGGGSFLSCTSLTSVTIGNGVNTIGGQAFEDCSALTKVIIPKNVSLIDWSAFGFCKSLTCIEVAEDNTAYKSIDGNLYTKDGKTLVQYAIGKKDTLFVLPEHVTRIGEWSFTSCNSLTTVILTDNLTDIGWFAFLDCQSLSSVLIPSSVTIMSSGVFGGAPNLTIYAAASSQPSTWDENWNPDNRPVVWGYGHQHTFENYECACGATEYVEKWDISATENDSVFAYYFSNGKLEISGSGNMQHWTANNVPWKSYSEKIKTVVIGNNITNIGNHAFDGFSNLASVTMGEGVTVIGVNAFTGCVALTSVDLSNITTIGNYAFMNCQGLESVVITSNTTSINYSVFYNCLSLTIYCEAFNQPSTWNTAWNNSNCPVVWHYNADHKYDSQVTATPTHTAFGEMTYTCPCGDTYTEVIEKIATHNWTPWQENEDGTRKERSCECGETDYIEIEKEDDEEIVVKPSKPEKDKDKNQIKIDVIFDTPTLEAIGIQIIPEIIEQLNNMETEVNTDIGTVILDAIASSKLADTAATVNIGIADVTTDKEDKQGRKVFSITINDEDGNPILPPAESEDNGTITLSMKYKKGLVKEQIKIAYRDENGKLEHMEVEKYDPETGEVTFKTTHLSDYVIYVEEEDPSVYLENAFTFLGYSTRENGIGAICASYEINYEAISMYEEATGKVLEFGIVFASYENLKGQQPLNADGTVATLEKGKVIKQALNSVSYTTYDFVLRDISDSIKDHRFVMSAYIYNGTVKYNQGSISETVKGVSYNQINPGE